MFKLVSIIGRASGLLLVGAGAGVAVAQADEVKAGLTTLKAGAVGLAAYYLVKKL